MSRLEPLLELQELDTTIDQLRHRRDRIPERAELLAHEEAETGLRQQLAQVQERRAVIARDLKRLEDHVTAVEEKKASVHGHLYGEGITSPKEAQTLQEELDALQRRQRGLEDEEIELMELAEPLDAELAALADRQAAMTEEGAGILARLAEAETGIAGELEATEAKRAGLAEGVDDELLGLYETMRRDQGGIAVARLVGGSCQGCHLLLSATARDRLKKVPEDDVAYCDECGRILIR